MSTNTALDQIKARVEGHSPTPWQAKPYLYGSNERVRVTSPDDGPDFNTAEGVLPADAELIAAAPKLLAALEAVERVRETMRLEEGKWMYPETRFARLLEEAITEALR